MASSPLRLPENAISLEVEKMDCSVHGPYEARLSRVLGSVFRTPCPTCKAETQAAEDARAKAQQSLLRMISLETRLGRAAIPKRFADKNFDGYLTEIPGQGKALRVCKDFFERFDEHEKSARCLLMLGKPGTGKTHLGASIANSLIRSGRTAVYRTIGSVFQDIRDSYSDRSDKTEGEILSPLVGADLLVLDEIGVSKEQPSDFELRTIFSIINGRYESMRPTVVISNLGVDEVKVALGERSADRLREGGVIVLIFDWASMRGNQP